MLCIVICSAVLKQEMTLLLFKKKKTFVIEIVLREFADRSIRSVFCLVALLKFVRMNYIRIRK